MSNFSLINYKGVEILYFDHRNLTSGELLNSIKNANKIIKEYGKKPLYTLANFENAFANEEVMTYLKSDEEKEIMKMVDKSAFVGITGIKKIFLNIVNKLSGANSKAFKTEDEAKDYLVK